MNPPCIALSVLSGCCTSAATNVLAYTSHLQETGKASYTAAQKTRFVAANLALGLIGIALFVVASGFGPIALAMPMVSGTGLLSNMLAQMALGMTRYTKAMRVGTLVLVFAVVCLVDIGPREQEGQNPLELLSTPLGLACVLGDLALLAGGLLCARALQGAACSSVPKVLACALVVASSTVLAASLGKLMQMHLYPAARILVALCYLGAGACSMLGGAVAAKTTDCSLYMPVYYCLQLVLNCVVGLCVWQDYKVIENWTAYISVYVLVLLGAYEASSVDLFERSGLAEFLWPHGPRESGAHVQPRLENLV